MDIDSPKSRASFAAGGADGVTFDKSQFGQFQSKTALLRPDDLGVMKEVERIQKRSIRLSTIVTVVSITSLFGLAGALVATMSELSDIFDWNINPAVLQRSFLCSDDECALMATLTALKAADWMIAIAGYGLSVAGYLGLTFIEVKRLRREVREIKSVSESLESDRYLHLGSGEVVFLLGDEGIRVRGAKRDMAVAWESIDPKYLYHEVPQQPDPLPRWRVEDRPIDLRGFVKTDFYSEPYSEFRKAVEDWCSRNEWLNLPVTVSREPDPEMRAREWLRLPKRYFTAGSDITWPELIAAIWMKVEDEYAGQPESTSDGSPAAVVSPTTST